MSKILFLQNFNRELYGIMSLYSYLKNKHTCFVSINSYLKDIKKFSPDIIGLYVTTKDQKWLFDITKKIKNYTNLPIIVGGPHPTHYPDLINSPNIDMVCVGEGEKPLLNLLDKIDKKQCKSDILSLWVKEKNTIFKNKPDTLLNDYEIPKADIRIYERYKHIIKRKALSVSTSRGCTYKCSFCANYSTSFNPRIRPAESIISEILYNSKYKKVNFIEFHDEIFGFNKNYIFNFLKLYKEKINIPFYCLLRFEFINEELVVALKESGCVLVGLGLETGNEKIRNKILGKKLTNSQIIKAAGILNKLEMKFHTFNMFCLPNETLKEAYETLNLNLQIKPTYTFSSVFQPYPGTKFFKEAKNKVINTNFNRFTVNFSYTSDFLKIYRIQKLFVFVVKFPRLKYFLPFLINLPFDKLYDSLCRLSWYFTHGRKTFKGV